MSLTLPPLTATDPVQAIAQLRAILAELEGQISAQTSVAINAKKTSNSVVIDVGTDNLMRVGKADSKGQKRYLTGQDLGVLRNLGTNYVGLIQGTAATPSLSAFPNAHDWGWYNRTSTNQIWLTYNKDGTNLVTRELV